SGRYPQFSGSKNGAGVTIRNSKDGILKNVRAGNDASGRNAIPNSWVGIHLDTTLRMVVSNSVLSGNKGDGITVRSDVPTSTSLNTLYLGTDATGAAALPNGYSGAWIDAPKVNMTDCVASGNGGSGIGYGPRGTGNIKACKAGTNKNGAVAIPNVYQGVAMAGAKDWTVSSCVLSGNGNDGIAVYAQAARGSITACRFGLGPNNEPLPDHSSGIWIGDGSDAIAVSACTIAGIEGTGINIGQSTGVSIKGSTVADCNGQGIAIYGGASTAFVENVTVSGCKVNALAIFGEATQGNTIRSLRSQSNGWAGIQLFEGTHHNRIESSVVLGYTGIGIGLQDGTHHN
ncbi:right-handed parallel beta-helix repeat-containing protein, partial [bacterium]